MQILQYQIFLFKAAMFILLLEWLFFIYAIKFQWEMIKTRLIRLRVIEGPKVWD